MQKKDLAKITLVCGMTVLAALAIIFATIAPSHSSCSYYAANIQRCLTADVALPAPVRSVRENVDAPYAKFIKNDAGAWVSTGSTAGGTGTVTSVTAGDGMTQTGDSAINPTLNVVSHAGSAGAVGTITVTADSVGVTLGATSTTAAAGNDSRLSDARTPTAHTQAATTITNTPSGTIEAVEVQAAINELGLEKVSVDALSATITMYPTTAASPVGGYVRVVTSVTDADYDEPEVDVPTGLVTGAEQLLSSLAADQGVITGNPGVVNLTVVGSIRRLTGSGTATFHFHAFHRTAAGVETELGVSSNTLPVGSATYAQYDASLLLNNGTFGATDRLVYKFYASRVAGGSDPTYELLFGGDTPIRMLVPVPVSVIGHNTLAGLNAGDYRHLTATQFTGLTAGTDANSYHTHGRVVQEVRNETGFTLSALSAVYVCGFNNVPLVCSGSNANINAHHVVGIVPVAIPSQTNGLIVVAGSVTGVNTSVWAVGDELYLYNAAGGDPNIVNYRPIGGEVVFLGEVTVDDVAGAILVYDAKGADYMAAASAQDIDIRMGDSVGATSVKFEDFNDATVASINSDGAITAVSINDGAVHDLSYIRESEIARQCSGLVSGGTITSNTTTVSIAGGVGYVNNHSGDPGSYARVDFGPFANQALAIATGANYVHVNADGSLHLSGTRENLSDHVYLGHFYASGGNVVEVFNVPEWSGHFPGRVNEWMRDAAGVLVKRGTLTLAEQAAGHELEVSVSPGEFYARLGAFDFAAPITAFGKMFNSSDNGWVGDSDTPSHANTTQWNNVANPQSTALVTMTDTYWKKDVFLLTPAGNLYFIFAQAEYPTEDDAITAALPNIPEAISEDSALLAAVVVQKGDTSIANNLLDIRPDLSRLLGAGTSSAGVVLAHEALSGRSSSDQHPIAAVTGLQTDLAGKVVGPASATDNAVARFDGTTGKLVQNSAATINDVGTLTITGTETFAAPHKIYLMGDSLTGSSGHYGTTLAALLGGGWQVVWRGVSGNTTTQMLSRFVADVITPGDAEYVVVWGGVNDIAADATIATITGNLQQMYDLAHTAGLKVIAVTITPFSGDAGWDSTSAASRAVQDGVNFWIKNQAQHVDYRIDAYAVMVDPSVPYTLLPAYDDGGHLHFTTAGYEATGTAIYNGAVYNPLVATTLTSGGAAHFSRDISAEGVIAAANLQGNNTGDQNISGLVPYTGATAPVALGGNAISATGATSTTGFVSASSVSTALEGIAFNSAATENASIKQQPSTGELRVTTGRNSAWGGYISAYTDTVERVRITPKGSVGIGTTAPTSRFQVNQPTTDYGTVSNSAGGTTVTGSGTQFFNTFKVGDSVTIGGETVTITAIASSGSMTVSPAIVAANSGAAYTLVGGQRFSVMGNGNVGFGISFPSSLAQFSGSLIEPTGDQIAYRFDYTTNKATSGNDVGLRINQTDTLSPGVSKLISAGTGGGSYVEKFGVDNVGDITAGKYNSVAISGSSTPVLAVTGTSSIANANTGDNAANSTYAADYRAANFVAGTNYLAPNGSAAALTSFPTLNQNTSGTAANLSGTPALPNGTTATTQTQADATTKIATTAYVDTGLSGKAATSHNQDATTITTGSLDGDLLPALSATKRGGAPATGTPSGKYLKDDGTWAVPTASVSLDIQDEGGSLTTAPSTINFAGAGVTATEPVADSILVTIPGYTTEEAQDATGAMATGSITYVDATPALQLDGDSAAPGNSYYYGTNSGGTKGFYTLPAGGDMLSSANLSDVASAPTSLANLIGTFTGNSLKPVRVNSGETDLEYYTPAAGGGGDGGFSLPYAFDTATTNTPAAGEIRYNNATPASATQLFINETAAASVVVDLYLDGLFKSDYVMISNADKSKYHIYQLNDNFTSGAGVDTLPVTYLAGAGTLTDAETIYLSFSRAADILVLGPGSATVPPMKIASGTNTTTAQAGAFGEYDGKSFYASVNDSARGVIQTEQFMSLTSTYTLTSQTAAQKAFNVPTNGAFNAAASTSYWFECSVALSSMSATSGSFGFAWGGTATLTSQGWTSTAKKTTVATAATAQTTYNTAANTTLATASTTTTGWFNAQGIVRVNAAGTLIPQVSLGVAAAAVVGVNSWCRLRPIGTNTVTYVGNFQ